MMDNQQSPTSPSSNEIKLIIDVALLEQEKRITKSLGDSISAQNKTYLDHILEANSRLTTHDGEIQRLADRMKALKWIVTTASAASAVISGLVGFFVGKLQ